MEMKFGLQFTATVFNPDTEETFTGWVDMDWNRFELRSDASDVRMLKFEDRATAVRFIESEVGAIRDNGDGTFYAEDSRMNLETGEDWSYAGHITEL